MKARDRAQAIRDYRHYRAMVESKRLSAGERRRVASVADALASRYNLTTARLTA